MFREDGIEYPHCIRRVMQAWYICKCKVCGKQFDSCIPLANTCHECFDEED